MSPKLILASTSPRRKEIAAQIGLEFEIVHSNYEEDMTLDMTPDRLAETLALGKAQDVANKINEGVVLGIDTFVVFEDKRIGKPTSEQDAINMLTYISGKNVFVYSGVALVDAATNKHVVDHEIATVTLKKLEEEEIKRYVASTEPMDKAGSFDIQGLGSIFVARMEGGYHNVRGFPVQCVYKNLQKMGIDIFKFKKWNSK